MALPRPDLRIEALASHHDREGLSCGVDSLDRYLRTQASQDVRRKANGVFILVEPNKPSAVLGYYTLRATALAQGDVPVAARKHVPRYPMVSATLLVGGLLLLWPAYMSYSSQSAKPTVPGFCLPAPCLNALL